MDKLMVTLLVLLFVGQNGEVDNDSTDVVFIGQHG